MGSFIVIAKAKAKPGMEGELESIFRDVLPPTLEETGNHGFTLYTALDDSSVIVALEDWESKASWEAHLETPHVKEVGRRIEGILAEPFEVQTLAPE